jgi:hypothetical protein
MHRHFVGTLSADTFGLPLNDVRNFSMRIVMMGTGTFAEPTFEAFLASHVKPGKA